MGWSGTADWVVASDLTYNSGSWRVLAETMATVLKPNGTVIYLSCGHEGFNVNAELDGFLSVAKEVGLVTVESVAGVRPAQMLPTLLSPTEAKQLEKSGGVRVVLLQRKPPVRMG